MNQNERVLDWLQRYGSITQKDADSLAVKRLASRINDLKKMGHPIISVREDGVNIYGEKCHWARYRMGARA